MYVHDYNQYCGSLSVTYGYYYVWPPRLLSLMGNNRKAFGCPAALPESAWQTNVNPTLLGATGPDGVFDRFGIGERTRWNNDNQPHNEVMWSVNPLWASQLDM